MERLDKLYEKFNGNYFGIIAITSAAICIIIAYLLYTEADPNFSIASNFISDLGVGPNGSDVFFGLGMILLGTFIMPFFTYLGRYLQKRDNNPKPLRIGIFAGLIGSIGIVLVGVFPLDPDDNFSYNIHIIFAGVLFYGILTMLLIYGIFEYRNPVIPNILSILAFITAAFYGFFITSVVIQYLTSTPFQAYTYTAEWIGSWLMGVWIIAHVYYTLKHR